MRRLLGSIEELINYCKEVEATQPAYQAAESMCKVYAESPRTVELNSCNNPFSPEYRKLCELLLLELSGGDNYNPWLNELTPHVDILRSIKSPTPYQYGDSVTVSDFIMSWGWIFKHLKVRTGDRILEYGAGEGQLSIMLARMGCEVTIVDIDERYLASIKAQCESLGLSNIHFCHGEFGDNPNNGLFDRILFYEAFHHALEHASVLEKLHKLLAPGGCILFAGEPIVDIGDPAIPFPWGPRLDGISVRSSRKFGWCELGFQRPYFSERLMRSGYLVRYYPCPVTGRGDCYIATPTPIGIEFNLNQPYLLDLYDQPNGWHAHEANHRWTSGHAFFTLPDNGSIKSVSITVANHLPHQQSVKLRCGKEVAEYIVESGKQATIGLHTPATLLEIISPAVIIKNVDDRELGVAILSLKLN